MRAEKRLSLATVSRGDLAYETDSGPKTETVWTAYLGQTETASSSMTLVDRAQKTNDFSEWGAHKNAPKSTTSTEPR